MPRTRKCTVCNAEFMSHNGKEVCSEACAAVRKQMQDSRGNLRRKMKLSNVPVEKTCPVCGNTFMTIRNRHCSQECSAVARRKANKENMKEYYSRNCDKIKRKAVNRMKRMKGMDKMYNNDYFDFDLPQELIDCIERYKENTNPLRKDLYQDEIRSLCRELDDDDKENEVIEYFCRKGLL